MRYNKKAGSSVISFLTTAMIYAFIVFILFLIAGSGGLFGAAFNIGKLTASITALLLKIPVWFYLILGVLWLLSIIRGD